MESWACKFEETLGKTSRFSNPGQFPLVWGVSLKVAGNCPGFESLLVFPKSHFKFECPGLQRKESQRIFQLPLGSSWIFQENPGSRESSQETTSLPAKTQKNHSL
jgi:hypothetical protein